MKILVVYLLAVNLLAYLLMGIDKKRAQEGRWRVSERALLLTAAAGGSAGAALGMISFRHKTRHLKFTLGIPLILLAQAGAAVAWVLLRQP